MPVNIPSSHNAEQIGEAARPKFWQPQWLNRDLALLFAGRGLRSLAQGYLTIIVPLYLAQLGYDAFQLGLLFTASAVASAALTAAVGFLSDRFGRRSLLIVISLLMTGGGIFFAISGNFIVLVLAAALGTIGRGGGAGSGGAWGPYYPAEQALIAEHASDAQRTTIFGALSFIGVLTGALGSLLAILPGILHSSFSLSQISGYRILFILTAFLGIAMALVVLPVREHAGAPRVKTSAKSGQERVRLSQKTWGLIWRFMITNATNGLAIGMLGSFIVYWFYRRYGVDANVLGGLFFIINLAAAVPYLLAGRLARKLGAVNTVVVTRVVAVILLAVMAVMPTFLLAAILYLVRMIAITLSNPVRQSYLMGVISPDERARAAGLANLPSQVAAAISPGIAGYIIQSVSLDLPLELAALFQAVNTILYFWFFRNVHPPEERQSTQKTESKPHAAEI
ncbi:MAG TPA: MFS transporter [Ktedonobacteraceae bacterium]|nr:MFS transporter [Ktedonobacteraceae bacterium]